MKQTAKKTTKSAKTAQAGNNKKREPVTVASLRTWNKIMAVVYAVQGAAILLLSATKTMPLTVSYLTEDPLATEAAGKTVWAVATRTLADVNLAYLLAAFLILSAVAHASAAWWWRTSYERGVQNRANRMRWIAAIPIVSLLFVTLAVLVGVSELAMLFLFVVLSLVAMLSAFVVERDRERMGKPGRLVYALSTIAAFAPMAVIVFYLASSYLYSSVSVPGYVTASVVSLAVLSIGTALVFRFQNQKKGVWANYLYSEGAFMILGLLAQTILAWVVYFGALQA